MIVFSAFSCQQKSANNKDDHRLVSKFFLMDLKVEMWQCASCLNKRTNQMSNYFLWNQWDFKALRFILIIFILLSNSFVVLPFNDVFIFKHSRFNIFFVARKKIVDRKNLENHQMAATNQNFLYPCFLQIKSVGPD